MARHGENIHKRKDGRWEGRYIKARTPDHKAVWGYLYGSSYTEVKQRLLWKKAEYSFYQVNDQNLVFSQLAKQWLVSIKHGIKESTLAHYHYVLHRYLLPILGEVPVKKLDEQRLEQAVLQIISPVDKSHAPLGYSSAKECLTMVRQICKYAARLRLMRPVDILIKLPQPAHRQTIPFSSQEQANVQAFVLKQPTPRKVGLLLQMQLGLRIGEVCGLQWGDFDLNAGNLTIKRTVSRIGCPGGYTRVVIQPPKTRSSSRSIPIPKELLKLLRSLKGETLSETWFLSGRLDKPVEPRCYRKSIQGYLRRAAVRQLHPHALRHTFATTCLQAGCDIKTLSELLGHADANITLKRYVHSNMTRKRTELEQVYAVSWLCYKSSISSPPGR